MKRASLSPIPESRQSNWQHLGGWLDCTKYVDNISNILIVFLLRIMENSNGIMFLGHPASQLTRYESHHHYRINLH